MRLHIVLVTFPLTHVLGTVYARPSAECGTDRHLTEPVYFTKAPLGGSVRQIVMIYYTVGCVRVYFVY